MLLLAVAFAGCEHRSHRSANIAIAPSAEQPALTVRVLPLRAPNYKLLRGEEGCGHSRVLEPRRATSRRPIRRRPRELGDKRTEAAKRAREQAIELARTSGPIGC